MSRKSIQRDSGTPDVTGNAGLFQSDVPKIEARFFEGVTISLPPSKQQLTIRLDGDILVWLKGQGRGYHTRINAILRAYYEAHKHKATRPS